MNDNATNLDRLHDLAMPEAVPWWPLAPGWYVVLLVLLVALSWFAWQKWKRWKSNAYRRAALRELSVARDAPTIAGILRRAALAVAGRETIAGRHGDAWLEWLAASAPETMSEPVRRQLILGVYGNTVDEQDVAVLRAYARRWISYHRPKTPTC